MSDKGAGTAASGAVASAGTTPGAVSAPATVVLGKSGKKICCACPDTKKPRDACVVTRGEDHCAAEIEAHKVCLRLDGFVVP